MVTRGAHVTCGQSPEATRSPSQSSTARGDRHDITALQEELRHAASTQAGWLGSEDGRGRAREDEGTGEDSADRTGTGGGVEAGLE